MQAQQKFRNMVKVDNLTAVKDFNRFVDILRVNAVKLEKLIDEKDAILSLIESGDITIDESGTLVYKLIEPIKNDAGDVILSTISFKSRRVRVEDIEKRMTGKNDIEKTRNMFAFLSGENTGHFSKMDGDDFVNISNVAAFFLPR